MNNNLKLFLELVANASGLRRGMDESRRSVHSFTQGAKREFSELKRAASSVGGMLAGLGISVGAVKIAMDSAGLDKSLTQIGQTAGASGREVAMLRQDLFRMGRESGQSIDELKGGFDALVQSGLSMKEATSTLDGVNVAMAVTGANAQTLSGGLTVAATAFQFDLAKPGQALELLDKMTVAGRLGNAELQNLSDIFAKVGVNAKSAGMDFDKTLAFIEGLSKVERNPERLATLADSTLRVFNNLNYQGAAQKATGVQFFDEKGNRRESLEVVNDLREKYQQLTTDKQRALFIQAAFGKADLDTIKGIKVLMTGDLLPQIRQFSGVIDKAGGTLKRDFGEATRNLIDQTGMLKNDLRQAADDFVKPINEVLGQFIQFLRDKKENGGLELDGKDMAVGGSALALGTLAAARYGSKALKSVAGRFLAGGASLAVGVAEGKALQAAAGVTPVFVTNWPAGFGAGSAAGAVAETVAGGAGARAAGKVLPWLKRAGGVLAASAGAEMAAVGASAVGGYAVGSMIEKKFIKGAIGEALYDLLHPSSKSKNDPKTDLKNDIKIDIQIDGQGRVVTNTNSMNNKVNTMKRGSFFDAMTSTKGMGY